MPEKCPKCLKFDFPGHQSDLSCPTEVLQHINIEVDQFVDAFAIAECDQKSQLSPVFPPRRVFQITAELSVLVKFTMVSQESLDRIGEGPRRRRGVRARGIAGYVQEPPILVELSNQLGEPAISELAASSFKRLPHPGAMMETIDVEGTSALIRSHFTASRAEKLASPEVPPEGVWFVFSFHVFTLPLGFRDNSDPHPIVSRKPALRRSGKSSSSCNRRWRLIFGSGEL